MNNVKAIGRVAEYKGGNSCRIEVLSFKRNGNNITNYNEIRSNFPPYGYVFAPKFLDTFDYDINSLIEFTTSSHAPTIKGENHDAVFMDANKSCKPVGFRVFQLPSAVLFSEHSFNQNQLKQFIEEELSHFYIRAGNFLYGPFKSTNHDVIPKTGVTVNKFKSTSKELDVDGKSFLLFEPDEILAQVDCMTQTQLAGFLKEKIRNLDLDWDVNQLKKALETQPLQGLDMEKMKRILANLHAFSISHDDIRSLITVSAEFKKIYQDAHEKVKEELKSQLVAPFVEEKNKLEQVVNRLTNNISKLKKEEEDCSSRLDKLQKEFEFISSEKERLISDIRTHAMVNQHHEAPARFVTYEEQLYLNRSTPYTSLTEFIDLVNSSILTNENGKGKIGLKAIAQFKEQKCLLCRDIRVVLQITKLSNNCRLIIQQVEPDWLKFEKLYNNGLEAIWRSAHNEPDVLHFFILQDLNLASIECYGKPVLDMLDGIREKLPGTGLKWPDNLWIFGLPVKRINEEFGLPLIEATFDSWGFFPIHSTIEIDRDVKAEKFLTVSQIRDHNMILSVEKNQYFVER